MSKQKSYLQGLVNAMQEFSEHNLVGVLHYGPQLGKIVSLLESYLQNGWYKLITEQNVQKPQRWLRMIIYLEAQLSIIQTRAFEEDSVDLKQEPKRETPLPPKNNSKGSFAGFNNDKTKDNDEGSLCDEKHPSANKGFVNCKKFLGMSNKERNAHVMKKKRIKYKKSVTLFF